MYEKEEIQQTKQEKQLMKLNRLLSDKRVLKPVMIVVDIIFFCLWNTIINFSIQLFAVRNLSFRAWMVIFPTAVLHGYRVGTAYLILVIFLAIFDLAFIYRIRIAFAEDVINVSQKGSERWMTIEEIRERFREIPEKGNHDYPGKGGVIVSRYEDKIYIDDSPVNNLVIGMTRSGKGEMYVFPSIDVYSRAEEKPSLVVTDPKLELYKSSKATLEKRGYEVHVLNLIDPESGMGFNPLYPAVDLWKQEQYAKAEELVVSIATMFINSDAISGNNKYFYDAARDAFAALILAHIEDGLQDAEHTGNPCTEDQINLYSIANTFTTLIQQRFEDGTTRLDSFFAIRPDLDRAKMKYATVEMGDPRTRGNVFSTLQTKLSIFTGESIAKMTIRNDLDLTEIGFGEKPVAVFLGIPDYDVSKNFIASIFIREVYFMLSMKCQETGHAKRWVKFIMDEIGQFPKIDLLSTMFTMGLGRWISFDLYIQSYSMLQDIYGKETANILIENSGNQIYILTNDTETAKHFSDLIGSETEVDVQRSGGKMELHKHFMESTIAKPLLNPNELMGLQEGKCVIKQSMARRDLMGNKVKLHPIFNSVESGMAFKYRYQYLQEYFPDPDTINFSQICTESCQQVQPRNNVWNADRSFEMRLEGLERVAGERSRLSKRKKRKPEELPEERLGNLEKQRLQH